MPGRTPKPDALRARSNKESQSLVLQEDPEREVPQLPATRGWDDSSRDLWATMWTSGMAEMWLPTDMPVALRYVTVYDDFWRAETPEERRALSGELRQLEKVLGLNPEARVKLRWIILEAEKTRQQVDGERPSAPVSASRDILFQS